MFFGLQFMSAWKWHAQSSSPCTRTWSWCIFAFSPSPYHIINVYVSNRHTHTHKHKPVLASERITQKEQSSEVIKWKKNYIRFDTPHSKLSCRTGSGSSSKKETWISTSSIALVNATRDFESDFINGFQNYHCVRERRASYTVCTHCNCRPNGNSPGEHWTNAEI